MQRFSLLLVSLVVVPACGSRRVAGYLEDFENYSPSSSSSGTEEGHSAGGSEQSSSSGSGAETTVERPETTGTSTDATQGSSETTQATATPDESGGEPVAVCGNGVLEAFGAVPEECDDGNLEPDDGCDDTCALDRRAFVTSELYQGGAIESLYLANALCAHHAHTQGWPHPLKYRAWLSDSSSDARDRVTRGRGRLVLANGLVLAASWTALLAGQLENPIDVTEQSQTYHGGVWTGTRPDGTAVPGAEHCEDWASNSILKKGHYGYSDLKTAEWTLSELWDQPTSCPAEFALYCFQSL